MDRTNTQRLIYEFFQSKLEGAVEFTKEDIIEATGWKLSSVDTYLGKQWADFIEKNPDGTLRVLPQFRGITLDRFLGISTQRRQIFPTYKRVRYDAVISWEFLLPLTRESELRRALDDLFYSDSVVARLTEVGELIGFDELASWAGINFEEASHEEVVDAVATVAAERFFGYSISHVTGRFRGSAELLTREDAGEILAKGGDYLLDETTALVRFIVPIQASRTEHRERFTGNLAEMRQVGTDNDEVREDIAVVQALFFNLFVEAVVQTIQGEDEIWLIENTPAGERLFVWEKQ